jgi:uncharacterized protein (TIGR00369 family)
VTTDLKNQLVSDIREQVHPGCVVCSLKNGNGLHLHFDVTENGSVTASFDCDEDMEGYPGILHGGVITSILDGAMGHCIFACGQAAVTVEITVRFRHPVRTGLPATVLARIVRSSRPLYFLEAKIIQNEQVKAVAKGKFYDKPELISPN